MSDVLYNQTAPIMAARGQTYGKRKQQEDAQRAVPMGPPPTQVQAQRQQRPTPMAAGSFVRPTTKPDEPITAGAPFGPGLSPVAAGIPDEASLERDALIQMREIYRRYPTQEIADIIAFYEESLYD